MQRLRREAELRKVYTHRTQEEERLAGTKEPRGLCEPSFRVCTIFPKAIPNREPWKGNSII